MPNGAGDLVAFTKVRVVLHFPDGSLALDQVIDFPVGATELPVTLNVPLPASAPSGGVQLSLSLMYLNAAGETVFSGGPVGVTAVPATPGAGPPPPSPVNVPLTYTGPGSATATRVRINPTTLTANTGQAFNFTAQALDAAGNVISGVPIIFTSQNPIFASVNAATGAGTAGPSRGTVNIVAQLLTGPADAATLTIVAPPASLAAVGPTTRDGAVGTNVTPVVVQANATDGLPAPGVTVTFAAQNGGSVGTATAVTGANGQATTSWRLGPGAGPQTVTASASGLTGSPITFTATARTIDPVRLEFSQQPPTSSAAGSSLTPAIAVRAVDATGAVTTNFTGPISIALGAGAPTGSALSGTLSVNAVAGVASFGDLKINLPGTYTLVAASGALTGATSSSFQIVAGNANRLAFQAYPVAGAVAGATMDAITVVVRDALGNANTTFTGPVTLTANGPTVSTGANATDVADSAVTATSDVVLTTPLTVNAVAGVATFSNVQLNAAGSYTLTASSTGLTSATGPSFAITAGPASTLVLVSGGGQSAPGAAALASPVVVKVTDAVGNGIVGKTVTFTPAVGSGTANPMTAVTGAGGLAQTNWTIGAVAGPMTLNVSGTGLTPNPLAVAATATTTAGPGPATQLAFTTQPSNRTAGAVMVPAVVVTAKDALGAVATSFNGNVTLSILNNVGSSTLLGTTTVAASAGVATFGNVSLTNIGVGYTLQAVASGLTSATSGAFNITAAGAATIVADSGVGQSGTAGGALPQAFTVYVADGFGNPVAGTTVTWAVTGGGGSLSGVTTTTNANGRARAVLTLGTVAGANTVTATSTGLTGSPITFTATGVAGTGATLAFSVQPTNALAGAAITPAMQVSARDVNNNVVTSFTGSVALTFGANPGASTFTGTTTVNAVAGIATFPGIFLNKIGTGYTIVASSAGLTSATSAPFDITAAAANAISAESGDGQSATVGTTLASDLVVRVVDAFGNPVAGTTVAWAITGGGGSLAGTTTSTDANGRARTTLTLGTVAGANTVTATSTGLAGSPVTFTAAGNPGAASLLAITTGPTNTVAGAAITPAIVVTAKDASNNTATGFTGNITLAITANPSSGVLSGTATVAAVAGVATFPGLSIDKAGVGYSLTASSGALTTATTSNFDITAGAATQLVITAQPQATQTAGTSGTAIVVTAKDANNNIATGFVGTVTMSIATGPGGASIIGPTSVSAVAGVATFGGVSFDKAGAYTLDFSAPGPLTVTSSGFTVNAGAAANIAAETGTGQSGTVGATLGAPFVARVTDTYGNPVSGAAVAWAVTAGGGSLSAVSTTTDANGRASATLTLGGTAGANSVTATSGTLAGSPVTFTATGNPGTATLLAFTTQPSTTVAGAVISPAVVVTARDANGNTDPTFTGNVTIAIGTNPGGATLSGTVTVAASAGVATFSTLSLDKAGSGYTLTASGSVAGATSTAFAVTAGTATQLVVTTQPQATQTAGTSGTAIVVTARDANNNTATGFVGTVTMSIATGPGGASIIGPTSLAAVAGVATFGGVSFDKAGAYTLAFAAAGPITVTSSGFTVGAGAAVNIVADAGTGQAATVGTALGAPFVVRVTDTYGNPVSGITVNWAVTAGGGSISSASGATDVNGRTQTTLTLGNTAVTNTVTATSTGLTGSPVSFDATANPGAATKLVFLTGPSNVTAGIPISASPVVQAQDAQNNLVTSFTGTVAITITTNPGSATLGGTTSVVAAGGNATFANLRLNKTGVGYVITAASSGLASAVSGTFDVTPAPAQVLSVVSGDNQTALASAALVSPLIAKVVDSLGNVVPGVAGTWAVAGGGGSLSGSISTSSAAGEFTTNWTLGALAGPTHSVTLTVGGVATGSPLTFSATATSPLGNKVWTGANGTDLADPLNWSPQGAPVTTDELVIQAGGPTPTLSAAATFKKVTLAPGASLNLNGFTLTITGDVDAGTTIVGSGSSAVVLSGTGTLKGSIMVPVTITGTYTLSGNATVGGDLNIVNSGSLDLATFTMTAQANFSTQNSGTITMTQAGGALNVTGNASFGGGAETGKLLTGTVQVAGNFSQSGDPYSYQATGSHLTYLGGATQSITFTDLTGNSRFNHLSIENTNTNATTLFFANSVAVGLGVFTLSGSVAIVRDSITDPNDRWGIPTVRFIGTNVKIGNKLGTAAVRFGPNTTTLLANATLGGSAFVDSSGVLVLGGRTLAVDGNFSTAGGGRLNMTNASDVLDISGNVTFGGGSQTGLLTAGQLQVGGNLTQVNAGSGTEFDAAATHTTILDGGSAQTIAFADPDTSIGACAKSCAGSMTVTNTGGSVTFATPAKFTGSVSVGAGVTAFNAIGTSGGGPRLVGVAGGFSTAATTPSHITLLAVGGTYAPGAATVVDSVIFVGAGQAIPAGTYGEVIVRGTAALSAGITATGNLTVNTGSLTINGRRANVQGDFKTETGGTLIMTGAADTLDVTGAITFAGGAGSLTNGVILARGNFSQSTTNNAFSAVGQHITKFVGAGNQSINLTIPDYDEVPPLASGACQSSCFANVEVSKATGKLIFANHAKMIGSFTVFAAIDSITAYNKHIIVGGNFNPSTAPTRIALLSLGGALPNAATTTLDTLIHWGNTQVTKFPTVDLQVWGSDTISTSGALPGGLRVFGSGKIVFNAPLITIGGNFSTNGGSTQFAYGLNGDTVHVAGNVNLAGGTSAPATGRLEVEGDISLGGSNLAATGSHVTALVGNGAGTQTLGYGSPITAQGFRHLHFGGTKAKVVNGQVTATGNVELYSSTSQPITGTGSTVNIGGNFTDSAHVAGDTIGIWRVDNTTLYGNAMVRVGYMKTNLMVTGTTQFPALPQLQEGGASLQLSNALAFQGTTRVRGNLNVEGASGLLDLSASYVYVYGNFVTATGGRLESNQSIDYLWVSGNATFSGGTSILTNGTLEVLGNFSQSSSATAFAADTAHSTLIGSYTQVLEEIRLSQPNAGPRTRPLTAAQAADREAAHQRFLTRRRAFAARYNAARAAAVATGLPLPRPGTREVAPGVLQVSNVVSPSTVSFANPGGAGASHFGTWEIAENVVLTSDVNAGVVATYGDGSEVHGSNNLITSYNASLEDLTFDNVRWFLDIKALPDALDQVTFKNMVSSVDQFTVQGDGTIDPPALYYWNFQSLPTSGTYLRAIDTAAGGDVLDIQFTAVQPSGHGGRIALVGDATTNWLATAVATWTNPFESNNWDDATAWDIGVVPDSTVDVIIPQTSSSWPTLSGPRSARHLTIVGGGEAGVGQIHLNDQTLRVYGDIDLPHGAGTAFNCGTNGDGSVEMRKSGALVEGHFCNLTIAAGASATLTDNLTVQSDLKVLGGLTIGAFTLDLNGVFSTDGSGTLTMTDADGLLYAFDAVFAGGNTNGLLTNGEIVIDGSLTVSAANAYVATGAHRTTLDRSARVEALRMDNGRAAPAVKLSPTALARRVAAEARARARAPMIRARAATRATRATVVAARAPRAGARTAIRTLAAGAEGAIPVNYEASYVDLNFTNTTGNQIATLEMRDYVYVGTPSKVAKNASLGSTAYVEGPGRLIVTDTLFGHAYSYLYAAGVELAGTMLDSGTFSPDTTIWSGTNQYIPAIVQGGYSYLDYNTMLVSGTGARMYSTADYYTINDELKIVGSGHLRVGDAPTTTVYVYGNFATEGGGRLEMSDHDSTFFNVYGDSTKFGGGSTEGLLTKGKLYVGGVLVQSGDAKAFAADKGHNTAFGGSAHHVNFANPGFTASHFGDLIIEDDSLHFDTDVFVAGWLHAHSDGYGEIGSSNALITSRGATATRLRFYNTRWKIVPGDSISSTNNVEFLSMTPTTTYFTLERNGTGVLPTFDSWVFGTLPSGAGRYVEVNDLVSNADILTLTLSNVTPSVHLGKVNLLGGALLSGWTSGVAQAVSSGTWTSNATWSGGVRPDSTKHILIPTGVTVTLDTIVQHMRSLTTEGTGVLDQGSNSVYVHGNISADTLGGITCTSGITYQPDEVIGTVSGRFCRYHSGGVITLAGKMKVDSVWHVHDGTFNFNGKRVDTKQAWVGSGESGFGSGAIVMNNAADSLFVSDSMLVGDASNVATSSSQPNNGYIQVAGNFRVVGANGKNYFNPSASNKVRLTGTAQVFFSDTTASAFNQLEVLGTRTFASVVRVDGDLRNAGTITGASGRVKMSSGANLTGSVGSAITVRAFELAGTFADSGGFSPDTAVFNGGPTSPQIIPDTVGTASDINYQSIRIMNDATLLPKNGNSGWLINGKVLVDDAILRIGGGATAGITVADSLHIYSSGRLQMVDAASSLTVEGHARFAGSSQSGYLTAGTLTLLKNFAQTTSSTSFVATGSHTTVFAGTTDTVTFAYPANSKFNDVHVTAGSTIVLGSSMYAGGTLSRVGGASNVTLLGTGGNVQNFAVGGLNISGNPTTLNSVSIEFQDGTAFTTFNDVTFAGFNAFTGPAFKVNRSGGQSYTFTNLDFGSVLASLGSGGRLLENTLASNVTLVNPTPSGGLLNVHYSNLGGGTVTWP